VLTVNPENGSSDHKEASTRRTSPPRLKQIYDRAPTDHLHKGDPKARFLDVISRWTVARGAGVKVIGFTPKGA
jgi:hypothetical protein